MLDTKSLKIAFRRARVVQEKILDQEGLTFLFEINNVRIFCGGPSSSPSRKCSLSVLRIELDTCRLFLDHVGC